MNQTEVEKIIDRSSDGNGFPVQLMRIASELDISVKMTEEWDDRQSGSLAHIDGKFIIFLNSKHSQLRNRFTLAHEIGHYVKHRNQITVGQEVVSTYLKPAAGVLNRIKDTNSYNQTEREADEFAAELLMPENEFREKWRQAETIEEIADYFLVSVSAATVRGLKLDLGYFA